jgi:hypothetical protein
LDKLERIFSTIAKQFPGIKASVENIPTHLKGYTPFSLVKLFDNVILDAKWASMYDEFNMFEAIMGKIANIHLRGSLKNDKWFLDSPNLDFYEALDTVRNEWKHSGLLTVEPEDNKGKSFFDSFIKAMRSLRG